MSMYDRDWYKEAAKEMDKKEHEQKERQAEYRKANNDTVLNNFKKTKESSNYRIKTPRRKNANKKAISRSKKSETLEKVALGVFFALCVICVLWKFDLINFSSLIRNTSSMVREVSSSMKESTRAMKENASEKIENWEDSDIKFTTSANKFILECLDNNGSAIDFCYGYNTKTNSHGWGMQLRRDYNNENICNFSSKNGNREKTGQYNIKVWNEIVSALNKTPLEFYNAADSYDENGKLTYKTLEKAIIIYDMRECKSYLIKAPSNVDDIEEMFRALYDSADIVEEPNYEPVLIQ